MTRRRALLPDYAPDFERPGWSRNSKSLFKYSAEEIAEQKRAKLALKEQNERKKAARKKARKARS